MCFLATHFGDISSFCGRRNDLFPLGDSVFVESIDGKVIGLKPVQAVNTKVSVSNTW